MARIRPWYMSFGSWRIMGPLLLLSQAFSKCQFDCIDGCAAELFCIFAGCGVV